MNKLKEHLAEKYKKECENYLNYEKKELDNEIELSKNNMDGVEFSNEKAIVSDADWTYDKALRYIGSADYPALDEATKEMRSDENFATYAVINWQDNFQFVSPSLRNNADFIIYASICPRYNEKTFRVLSCIDTSLRDDGKLFYDYIARKMNFNSGYPKVRREEFEYYYEHELLWATERVRNDRDIILKIVSIEGRAYEDIGENLKNDYEIALTASQKGAPLRMIAPQFRNDEKIAMNCLKHTNYHEYPENTKEIELILNLMAISDELAENADFVASCIKSLPQVYNYFPQEMKMVPEYAFALLNTPNSINLLPKEFFQNRENALKLIKIDPKTIDNCSDLMKNPDFVKELISENIDVSKNLPLTLRLNKEFMLDAIKMDSKIKSVLPEKFAYDDDFKNL